MAAAKSWTTSYGAKVVDEEAEAAQRKAVDDAFLADVSAAWGLCAPGCSHDHRAEQRIFDLSEPAKLGSCEYLLACGHAALSEGQPTLALDRYRLCLSYTEYAFPQAPQDVAGREAVRARALLGSAAAHASVVPNPDWRVVQSSCSVALAALGDGVGAGGCLPPSEACAARGCAHLLLARASRAQADFEDATGHLDQACACQCGGANVDANGGVAAGRCPALAACGAYDEAEEARRGLALAILRYERDSAGVARRMMARGPGVQDVVSLPEHGPP